MAGGMLAPGVAPVAERGTPMVKLSLGDFYKQKLMAALSMAGGGALGGASGAAGGAAAGATTGTGVGQAVGMAAEMAPQIAAQQAAPGLMQSIMQGTGAVAGGAGRSIIQGNPGLYLMDAMTNGRLTRGVNWFENLLGSSAYKQPQQRRQPSIISPRGSY